MRTAGSGDIETPSSKVEREGRGVPRVLPGASRHCERLPTAIVVAVAAFSFVAFVGTGVPVLRHDWPTPSNFNSLLVLTGWDPAGIGSPVAYPSAFILDGAYMLAGLSIGFSWATTFYFLSIAALIGFGARYLAASVGAPRAAQCAAAMFALFNPWAYNELVAGHAYMLFSYGATFWLIADLLRKKPDRNLIVLLPFALAPQLQFLLIGSFGVLRLAYKQRCAALVLALAAALAPALVGIFLNRHALAGTEYTLQWERDQSLTVGAAALLTGYFTHYDAPIQPYASWCIALLLVLVACGVWATAQERKAERGLILAATTLPTLLWATGADGPLSQIFGFVVTHVPPSAILRELYDLVGFVAIGYIGLASIGTARFPKLSRPALGVAAMLLLSWIVAPPYRYWVSENSLPSVLISAGENSRFLLLPAVGPLRFGNRGSGASPNAQLLSGNVTALNGPMDYPINAAIGQFLSHGSTVRLKALSVRTIVDRPWLQTDPSVAGQLPFPVSPSWLSLRQAPPLAVAALPEMTSGPLPAVGSLVANVGAGNILFSDAREARGDGVPVAWQRFPAIVPIVAPNDFVSANQGWVDARLAFLQHPEIAQAFGGALTTNENRPIAVHGGLPMLVYVSGELSVGPRRVVGTTTGTFRWVSLDHAITELNCHGLCVIAAQASSMPDAPLEPKPRPFATVPFEAYLPWLVIATDKTAGIHLLRYNVAFDPNWVAIADGNILPHIRIDGTVNGWIAGRRTGTHRVVLVEAAALVTTMVEGGCLAIFVTMIVRIALRRPQHRHDSRGYSENLPILTN